MRTSRLDSRKRSVWRCSSSKGWISSEGEHDQRAVSSFSSLPSWRWRKSRCLDLSVLHTSTRFPSSVFVLAVHEGMSRKVPLLPHRRDVVGTRKTLLGLIMLALGWRVRL